MVSLEFFSDIILPFNAFHTAVLKINLLETVKHNRYTRGLEL